jgi:[histone H3]-lysine36 N-dimethyltransferase SETMAR
LVLHVKRRYRAFTFSGFDTKKIVDWTTLLHPAYFLDIAPSDYHLFRSMEYYFKHKTFQTKSGEKSAIAAVFNSKLAEFLKKGIFDLYERWQKVIINRGNYFI